MKENNLLKEIYKNNLTDELFEIFPPDQESEEERERVFSRFVNRLISDEKEPEEILAKLINLYVEAEELKEKFKVEEPTYLDGIFVLSNIIVNKIFEIFPEAEINMQDVFFDWDVDENVEIELDFSNEYLLDVIGIEKVDIKKLKEILKNKYKIDKPLYYIFFYDTRLFEYAYSNLLDDEEKIKAIEYVIEKSDYKKILIIQREGYPETLPLKYEMYFYTVKNCESGKNCLSRFYELNSQYINENEELKKDFIKIYFEVSKEEAKQFLLEKIDEFDIKFLEKLILFNEKMIEIIPIDLLKQSKFFRRIYRKHKKSDPLVITKKVKEVLCKKLYGQEHVIEKISDSIKNKLVFNEKSPRYTFTFLGPAATGKTYTARLLSEVFEGYKFKQFDMSLYEREDAGISLFGSDFKYANSAPGELTDFVLKNPKSIIVFDEIEKCHPQIQKQLLTIFSEGYLEDKHGWCKDSEEKEYVSYRKGNNNEEDTNCPKSERITRVPFKDTIIIFTSNAGEKLYSDNKFWQVVKDDLTLSETMIIDELQKSTRVLGRYKVPAIDPALLSRISSGEIVLFKELDFESIYKISKNMFDNYNEQLLINTGVFFDTANIEEFLKIFLLKYFPVLDIRRIKNKIANDIYDYVSDEMIKNDYTFDDFEKIELLVSEKSRDKFYEIQNQNQNIKEYFFKKNLTADMKIGYKFDIESKIISVVIKDFELKKFTNIRDIKEDLLFDIPEIKFSDIVGHKLVKEKFKQIVSFLKNAKKLKSYDVKMPKGMLLYGPPGTGKTMLVKALAAEAELPFFATTGSDLKYSYRDENEEEKYLMDRIFNKAKKYAPSIVFIDEIDAFGNRIENPYTSDYINKFLTHLSGFENEDNFVFVVAATNFKDRIDPAILRSGRIDIHIEVPKLDKEAREFFIKRIIKKLKGNEEDFNIRKLSIMTFGMTGADFEKLKTEIGVYLITQEKDLDEDILIKFINEIKYGREVEVEEELMKETAYHEAGHAVITKILLPKILIEQVTIIARENTLGFVAYNYEDIIANMTKDEIYNRIIIALAGRVAQKEKYKTIDTGAINDIQHATNLAKLYVSICGFDDKIGNVNLEVLSGKNELDETVRQRVIEIIKKATKDTEELIKKHWDKIEKLADILIEKEIVTNVEIDEIIKSY